MIARSAGGLLVPLALLRWTPKNPLAAASLVLLADLPFLIGLAAGAPTILLCITGVASAGATTVADVWWETALQAHVPPEVLSRVVSLDWVGSLAIAPLGYVLVGTVAAASGVATLMVVVILIHVIVRVISISAPSIRTFTAEAT